MATDVEAVIEDMVERLVEAYRPAKIILFGSYGCGSPRPDSDLDLLIIKETAERLLDRCAAVRRILSDPRRTVPLETLVLTPAEVSGRLAAGDQFVAGILEKGRVLYAA